MEHNKLVSDFWVKLGVTALVLVLLVTISLIIKDEGVLGLVLLGSSLVLFEFCITWFRNKYFYRRLKFKYLDIKNGGYHLFVKKGLKYSYEAKGKFHSLQALNDRISHLQREHSEFIRNKVSVKYKTKYGKA